MFESETEKQKLREIRRTERERILEEVRVIIYFHVKGGVSVFCRKLQVVGVVLNLYLYLGLQPLTLGQKGLLADHLLTTNKILRIQRKTVLLPMLVQSFLESIHRRS